MCTKTLTLPITHELLKVGLSYFTCAFLVTRPFNVYQNFYAPGLKGPPGASSVWIVCLSVRLSVRNSVPLINKVQYLKFGWSYSNQTWTVSSYKGCSHFTDITCPWGRGGVKIWDLEIWPYLDFVAARGIRVSQTCLDDLVTLTLKFDLLLENFNLGHSFLTRRGRDFTCKFLVIRPLHGYQNF